MGITFSYSPQIDHSSPSPFPPPHSTLFPTCLFHYSVALDIESGVRFAKSRVQKTTMSFRLRYDDLAEQKDNTSNDGSIIIMIFYFIFLFMFNVYVQPCGL